METPDVAVAFEWSAQHQAEYTLTLPTFAPMQWQLWLHFQVKDDQLCDYMNGMHMNAKQLICMPACAGKFGPDPTWPPHPHGLEVADPHQGAHQTPSTHLHTPTTNIQRLLYPPMYLSSFCLTGNSGVRQTAASLRLG